METRISFLFLLVILLGACQSSPPSNEPTKKSLPDSPSAKQATGVTQPKDSIDIGRLPEEPWKLSKDYIDSVVRTYPELTEEHPPDPDQAFYNRADKSAFNSEVGQDEYYLLYAYLYKKKQYTPAFAEQRKKLVALYTDINELFGTFEYGGTYFGHQYRRIPAYAEFALTTFAKGKEYLDKSYDIRQQKKLYIASLRQLIADESSIDNITLGKKKATRVAELNRTVDHIDSLITGMFYLRRAQSFQNSYYDYY